MELAQLGWNLLTLGFLGTLIFTVIQGWGYYRQLKAIDSGLSVPSKLFIYLTFVFTTTFIYGISKYSIALVFNGLLTLTLIPVVMKLRIVKGFNKTDWFLMSGLTLAAVLMVFSPRKDLFYFLAFIGSAFIILAQPVAI